MMWLLGRLLLGDGRLWLEEISLVSYLRPEPSPNPLPPSGRGESCSRDGLIAAVDSRAVSVVLHASPVARPLHLRPLFNRPPRR